MFGLGRFTNVICLAMEIGHWVFGRPDNMSHAPLVSRFTETYNTVIWAELAESALRPEG